MKRNLRRQLEPLRSNVKLGQSLWGKLSGIAFKQLSELTGKYRFSVAAGDLLFLDGRWYVTHAGLLRIAHRRRCTGIRTSIESQFSDSNSNRWVFRATVYRKSAPKGFVGYGDADPSNVSPLVRGAEMRVAETRAVNRALRKAYGIGLCSVEELGWSSSAPSASDNHAPPIKSVRFEWSKQWSPAFAGPTLPTDPEIRTRSHPREALRGRLLRN